MSELGEREAAVLCRSGKDDAARSAFRRLYELHLDDVRRLHARLLGDGHAADDATQETFVRVHHALPTCDVERPLRPWVLAIARNVAIDVLRARQKAGKHAVEEVAGRGPGVVETASVSEERRAVEDALATLAPEHRSILLLRHVHELKLEEIAEGSSCTVRTVRNRLRAAGALLGRELKRRGIVSDEVRS